MVCINAVNYRRSSVYEPESFVIYETPRSDDRLALRFILCAENECGGRELAKCESQETASVLRDYYLERVRKNNPEMEIL